MKLILHDTIPDAPVTHPCDVLVLSAHPGRVLAYVKVALPRERALSLRDSIEFVTITARLRELLEKAS